jgi:hypothetical protein
MEESSDESAQIARSSYVAVHDQTENNSKACGQAAYGSFAERVDLCCSS